MFCHQKAEKIVTEMTNKVEQITIENSRLRSQVDDKDGELELLNPKCRLLN